METKSWWKSKTLEGQICQVIGFGIYFLKLPIANEQIVTAVAAIFVLIGIIMTVAGRLAATKKLTI